MRLDLDSVKSRADLLAICGHDTALKKVANTNGGEWAGACPFCGGSDRFHVQPYARPFPLWMCRQCNTAWDTAIGYIARRDSLDPAKYNDLAEICRRAVGDLPTTTNPQPAHPAIPAYQPPAEEWQKAANQVIDECQAALWEPKYAKVLDYLRGRGLQDETIKHFRLGYCATGKHYIYGRVIAGLWVPRAVLIPCIVGGEVWYIKPRLWPGVPCLCQSCKEVMATPGKCPKCGKDTRYLGVKGNRTAAIYNADELSGAEVALFCEGEFDCMTAHQVLNGVLSCVTFGAAKNKPDLATWGAYLAPLRVMLSAYDMDAAGEAGAAMLSDLGGERVKLAPLPAGVKDINEYHQRGGDLWSWIKPYLEFYYPVEVEAPK